MDILLIPGLWLDGSVWESVVAELAPLGHTGVPITLPGQGDGSDTATLADQLDAVLATVDALAGRPLVVGHSAAGTLAWAAAAARPDAVAGVALIGGFPSPDGTAYFTGIPPEGGFLRFPGWAAFEGPDSADLDEGTRRRIAESAVPVPEAVAGGVVHYDSDRRFEVPVTLVCPEFSPDQARAWIDGGEVPELSKAEHLGYRDLDSGHWPMISRPEETAALLAEIAAGLVGAQM